jgi:hypothetical protein
MHTLVYTLANTLATNSSFVQVSRFYVTISQRIFGLVVSGRTVDPGIKTVVRCLLVFSRHN